MATQSSFLAWRIPWTEESGGLHSMGLQRDTTEQLSTAQLQNTTRQIKIQLPLQCCVPLHLLFLEING